MDKLEKKLFYKNLKKIPKAEIHLHSEAVLSKKLASKLLSRSDKKYKDMKNVNEIFSYNNLNDFIDAFLKIQNSFSEIGDFSELFNCIRDYLKSNNIVYSELFFSPSLFLNNGWQFDDIMNVFVKKINKISKKDKIKIKILVDVSRSFGKENAMRNFEYLRKYNDKTIVGIGLGGYELNGPAKEFVDVFKNAKKSNYHRVAHAGEDDGPESVWDSLKLLDAERIGHGIASIQDNELIAYLVEKQIPLEVCPTSNVFTKRFVQRIEDHPIYEFYKRGVLVTLNTDDPTFFGINLIDEYWNIYSKSDLNLTDIKNIIINGFKASFLKEKQKKKYIKKVNKCWEKYFSNYV